MNEFLRHVMEMSTVQSTTGNSLETSKAQEQQGTNLVLTQVESGRSTISVSILNFTHVSVAPERLNIILVGFLLSVLFAFFQPT